VSTWQWLVFAVVGLTAISAALALAIGIILADIGRRASELFDDECWSAVPPRVRVAQRGQPLVLVPSQKL
jgi:hypothetical protein